MYELTEASIEPKPTRVYRIDLVNQSLRSVNNQVVRSRSEKPCTLFFLIIGLFINDPPYTHRYSIRDPSFSCFFAQLKLIKNSEAGVPFWTFSPYGLRKQQPCPTNVGQLLTSEIYLQTKKMAILD
ncbi:hypothetical protein J6590_016442 [Homalodisca vitripennis]|nr:hypothetical protein J6590_016442 [Homalodisca vitripennis]